MSVFAEERKTGDGPVTLASYPSAILHFDADAFFASVEQALHPALKGRPVVTGRERGIIACASYEAKALGIRRGVSLRDARKICPRLVVLPSDYETYSLYSKRLFEIARRFTPMVEEYSIDEGFADLTGLRRVFRTSYPDLARRFQEAVRGELGITVSAGLSPSKSLSKIASKYRKPAGLTAVAGCFIHRFLPRIPLEGVWGFGPNTVELLRKQGVRTAWDFACRPEDWAERLLGKVGREIRLELRGAAVYPVETEERDDYASIGKCKTFAAPSADREFVYAKLVRNVESACIKLRRHRLRARDLTVILRGKEYTQEGLTARLNRAASAPHELMPAVRALFDRLYRDGAEYRATMVHLAKIESDRGDQLDLFEDRVRIDRVRDAAALIDRVSLRYGKHAVSLGPSLFLPREAQEDRDRKPWRKNALLTGETERRRLSIPRLEIRV
jgi:DNA polymerase IV